MMSRHRHFTAACVVALCGALMAMPLAGCGVFGAAARVLPPPTVKPQYTDFNDKSVGVMVWVDRGTRMEWPALQLDLAKGVQARLARAVEQKKAKYLAGTRFPHRPESIVRYQTDYPEVEMMPVERVAPQLKVDRLIYVEIEDFSTRAPNAVVLYRGAAEASVQLIEVSGGTGTRAFEESGIRVVFPPKAPEEGIPNATDDAIYRGTISALADQIVQRFVPYQQEQW